MKNPNAYKKLKEEVNGLFNAQGCLEFGEVKIRLGFQDSHSLTVTL
jgi:hypothetical protein